MKDGFIRVAAATPKIRVADPVYNREAIESLMRQAAGRQVKAVVFPELCLTGYTCGDLFLQDALLRTCKEQLRRLVKASAGSDMLVFVGMPWERQGQLYNAMAVLQDGRLLGVIPKRHIPNYSEFYEARHFHAGNETPVSVRFRDLDGAEYEAPMGTRLLFACRENPAFVLAGEICEDLWNMDEPGTGHAMAGATVLVNASASDETTGKSAYRRALVTGQSARLLCAYVYASAGEGESSTDLVFGGHDLIAENGTLLTESKLFDTGLLTADLDLGRIGSERRRIGTCRIRERDGYVTVPFSQAQEELLLERAVLASPFVPEDAAGRRQRCEEILSIQAMGLKKRLEHTGCKSAVVGISGGLDSTLALLVTVRAFDLLGLSHEKIVTVTMPCFGTTDRTYENACTLMRCLGTDLREVDIREAVKRHFKDIGHDETVLDVTYENSQARERTQVLMDIANRAGGLVIGTGDMSELALGWATYNGDHMSMYGVNASVPKTLVRHLVRYYADTCGDARLSAALLDVLDTPVSPELLPPEDGRISQKTEDLVGPYELHDFFLYYALRWGYTPAKIYRLACLAFDGAYNGETIKKWLKTFYRRFFSQQFKRSCLPDGPKVGSVAVSPRGDLRMPSDAAAGVWLAEAERL